MITKEQVTANVQSSFETFAGLQAKAFEGFEKLVELNLQAVKATLGETADAARAVMSAKDASQLMAVQANLLKPSGEKAAAYGRHVSDIVGATSAEFTRVAEANFSDAQRKVMDFVDNAAKNAPAGGGNAVVLMKSSLAAASSAYDSVNKAAKQASDLAQANLRALSASAVKATQVKAA